MVVTEPFEFWDQDPGETRVFRVEKWEEGQTDIVPRNIPNARPKRIQVLRLHLPLGIKPTLPYYWDITSKTLIAGLLPVLRRPDYGDYEFTVTKFGTPPRARFSLNWEKLE